MASYDEEGNSHDKKLTRFHGYNEDAMANAAKEIISQKKEHVHAIAHALDQKKTLTGSEVRSIIQQVDEGKNKPLVRKADIHIRNSDGTEQNISNVPLTPEGTLKPIEMTAGQWVYLGNKAKAI